MPSIARAAEPVKPSDAPPGLWPFLTAVATAVKDESSIVQISFFGSTKVKSSTPFLVRLDILPCCSSSTPSRLSLLNLLHVLQRLQPYNTVGSLLFCPPAQSRLPSRSRSECPWHSDRHMSPLPEADSVLARRFFFPFLPPLCRWPSETIAFMRSPFPPNLSWIACFPRASEQSVVCTPCLATRFPPSAAHQVPSLLLLSPMSWPSLAGSRRSTAQHTLQNFDTPQAHVADSPSLNAPACTEHRYSKYQVSLAPVQ